MHPSGIRIGVPEITRLGMEESEMEEIANFIKRVVIDKQDPILIANDVKISGNNSKKYIMHLIMLLT